MCLTRSTLEFARVSLGGEKRKKRTVSFSENRSLT